MYEGFVSEIKLFIKREVYAVTELTGRDGEEIGSFKKG